jgi:hypothetical protein
MYMESNEAAACYRLYAAHCVQIAQHTSDPQNKALLLTMAQSWFVLADRADTAGDQLQGGKSA